MVKVDYLSYNDKKKLCALLVKMSVSLIIESKQKKKRNTWARDWLKRRNEFGCYENLMRELALEDAEGYRQWIRMDTESFEYLLQKVTPLIEKKDTIMRKSILPGERLALTLRYLATGETQRSLAFNFRIAQNTISGILPVVCQAIYQVLKEEFMPTPSSEEDWRCIADNFAEHWNFPMCVGAMDGKHVRIVPPPCSGSSFYNYKGDFSIVLLALVDADLKFIYVDVGTNGRISDGGVWAKSSFKKALDEKILNIPEPDYLPQTNIQVPFVIVAVDAFPLSNYIMKLYPGSGLDNSKIIYNYRLSRARRVAENAFGILASRFQIFKGRIPVTIHSCKIFVMATCALHNFLRTKSSRRYTPQGSLDYEDGNGNIVKGDWRQDPNGFCNLRRAGYKPADSAKEIQRRFCEYFNGVGSVPWQNVMCKLH